MINFKERVLKKILKLFVVVLASNKKILKITLTVLTSKLKWWMQLLNKLKIRDYAFDEQVLLINGHSYRVLTYQCRKTRNLIVRHYLIKHDEKTLEHFKKLALSKPDPEKIRKIKKTAKQAFSDVDYGKSHYEAVAKGAN